MNVALKHGSLIDVQMRNGDRLYVLVRKAEQDFFEYSGLDPDFSKNNWKKHTRQFWAAYAARLRRKISGFKVGGVGPRSDSLATLPLKHNQEVRLFKALKETGDQAALRDIVESHQPLVKKLAKQFMRQNILPDDLVSEGNVGLMRALYKFNPENGNRFSTYATHWIKDSMRIFTRNSWSMVRIGTTVAQRKMFSNLRSLKARMGIYGDTMSHDDLQKIAHQLNVSEADVVSMDQRMAGGDHSLNAPLKMDGESELQDWLVNGELDPEAAFAGNDMRSFRGELLDKAMKILTKREQEILTERRLSDDRKILGQLGENYKITRQRVHQIEAHAFKKLQKAMLDGLKETGLRPQELFDPAIDYEKKMAIG